MKRIGFVGGKAGLLLIEGVAVLGVVFALFLGAMTWRLQQGPMDLDFAKDYIAESLSDDTSGTEVSIGEAALYWPDLSGPLFIGIKNIQLTNKAGQKIVEVGEAAIGLSRSRLLIGRIAPTALIIKNPGLRVIRRADNTLDFGFASGPEPQAPEGRQSDVLDMLVQFVAHPGDEKAASNRFYRLRALSIENASLMVEDHRLGVSWFAQGVNLSMRSGRRGLEAAFNFTLPGAEGTAVPEIKATASYDWDQKILDFKTDLKDFNLQFITSRLPELGLTEGTNLPLNGSVSGRYSKAGGLETMDVSLSAPEGKFRVQEIRDAPLVYKNMSLEIGYSQSAQTADIKTLSLEVEGVPIEAHGALKLTPGDGSMGFPAKAEGTIEADIDSLDHAQIVALWPAALAQDSSREWFVDKIKAGTYKNLKALAGITIAKTKDQGWQADVPSLTAQFQFSGADVDYHAPLTAIKGGSGSGEFDLAKESLDITLDGGSLGDIAVEKAGFAFANIIEHGKGHLTLNAKLKGPLKGFLDYAAKDPIRLTDSLGFDVKKAKGDTALDVMLDFPTHKDVMLSEFKIDIGGTINNSFIPKAVGQADLSGGPLKIKADQDAAVIEGTALLGGQPMTLKREGFLRSEGKPYKSKTTASLSTTPALREALGIDVSEFVSGVAGVSLQQTQYADGKAEADISVDLKPGLFFITPLGYEKAPGTPGTAKMKAVLQDDILQEIRGLSVETDRFKLSPSQLSFTQQDGKTLVQTASVPGFTLDETKASLEMQRAKSGQMKIVMKGPFLDARAFLKGDGKPKSEEPETPRLISVAVDNMRTADDQTVKGARIYADINADGAFDQFEVDAQAGKGAVYLRFKPDKTGKRSFEFEADDAGAALKAFGVYDKVVGGTIKVHADPIAGPLDRNLKGRAVMQDFKAVKAPALAQLLGALSVPGLLDLLGNDGLVFSKLESDFTWTYKKGGSLITLKDGRTSGNSLGLTFDGTMDRASGTMKVEGTIIPLSTVNKIVGSIPLIGDIITGGTGSVFAATYTMKGPMENPDVMVNPLAVLTPGILRRILFE